MRRHKGLREVQSTTGRMAASTNKTPPGESGQSGDRFPLFIHLKDPAREDAGIDNEEKLLQRADAVYEQLMEIIESLPTTNKKDLHLRR